MSPQDGNTLFVRTVRVRFRIPNQGDPLHPALSQQSDDASAAQTGLPCQLPGEFLDQNSDSGVVRHQTALTAVERFISGLVASADHDLEPSTWHSLYTRRPTLLFEHEPLCIATTLSVPRCTEGLWSQNGMQVLDAEALAPHWGPLGDACKALGIVPFAKPPPGSQLQRALHRAMIRLADPIKVHT